MDENRPVPLVDNVRNTRLLRCPLARTTRALRLRGAPDRLAFWAATRFTGGF